MDQEVTTEQEQELTLQEFCIRLSTTDRRVEMIGAFEHVERLAGRAKDTETAYAGRYSAFCNKPA
jgi:hypothetical protein